MSQREYDWQCDVFDPVDDVIPDTQRDAYDAAQEDAPTLRAAVVWVLMSHPAGLTADEIAACLSRTPFAIRPRVTELKQRGRIVDTGARRCNESGHRAMVVALPRAS